MKTSTLSLLLVVSAALQSSGQPSGSQPVTASKQAEYRKALNSANGPAKTKATQYVDELEASKHGSEERASVIARIWQSEEMPREFKNAVLREALKNDDGRPVESALTAIARMGDEGKTFSPDVVAVLRDHAEKKFARLAALQALGEIADAQDTNSIEAIADVLRENVDNLSKGKFTDYSETDFAQAAKSLGRFGHNAVGKTDLIAPLLTNRYFNIQFDGYVALSRIENPTPTTAGLSKENLKERNSYFNYVAIQNGSDAVKKQAVPLLLSILNENPPGYLRLAAVETLAKLKVFDSRTIPFLLNSGPYGAYLTELGPEDKEAIPALIDGLATSSEAGGRKVAAEKLCLFGPQAKGAVNPILDNLRKADARTDFKELGSYLQLLRSIGTDAAPASDLLVQWQAQDSSIYSGRSKLHLDYFRAYALETLSHVGTPVSALPYILDALNNGNSHAYVAAARAAGSLGEKASVCVPALQKSLKPESSFDYVTFDKFMLQFATNYTTPQAESIRALAKIGPDARAALPRLRELADGSLLRPGFDDKAYAKGLGFMVPDIQEEAQKAVKAIESR